jgi:hypothetical protein
MDGRNRSGFSNRTEGRTRVDGAAIKSQKFSQKLTDKKWRILTLNPSKGKEFCDPSLHFSRVSRLDSAQILLITFNKLTFVETFLCTLFAV